MAESDFQTVAAWKPLLPAEVKELPKEDLMALCSRSAYRILAAMDRWPDPELEDFVKKRPKEAAVAAGVLIDKEEVLRKQPEREAVIRDEQAFARMGEMLMRVIEERGLKIEIPGPEEPQPEPVTVEATVVVSDETPEFGPWHP